MVQAFRNSVGPQQLFRMGAVGDVPRLHPARPAVQAVRPTDSHHPSDAGIATPDQSLAEEVRQGPPTDGAGDAETSARTRLQPDPWLPADARANPGVPGAVPRPDVFQPDSDGYRPVGSVGGGEPVAGQLCVQRGRCRPLPRRAPVRRPDRCVDYSAARPGGVYRFQPSSRCRSVDSADAACRYCHLFQQPGLDCPAEP